MKPGRQWKEEALALGDVREHKDLQGRVNGTNPATVRQYERVLKGGSTMEPVQVARIGKALYLLDGYHRLEAHRRAGMPTIRARVAKMSLSEAKTEALTANTKHGKPLSRADKAQMFDRYVDSGKHVDEYGDTKACRAIAAELNHIYSYETIRQKLKALGVPLNEAKEYPGGYKPYSGSGSGNDDDDDIELGELRASQARQHLESFRALFPTLDVEEQKNGLAAARDLVERLERGERPERVTWKQGAELLDI